MAARRLDPANQRLPEQIRTLDAGEAFVKFAGSWAAAAGAADWLINFNAAKVGVVQRAPF